MKSVYYLYKYYKYTENGKTKIKKSSINICSESSSGHGTVVIPSSVVNSSKKVYVGYAVYKTKGCKNSSLVGYIWSSNYIQNKRIVGKTTNATVNFIGKGQEVPLGTKASITVNIKNGITYYYKVSTYVNSKKISTTSCEAINSNDHRKVITSSDGTKSGDYLRVDVDIYGGAGCDNSLVTYSSGKAATWIYSSSSCSESTPSKCASTTLTGKAVTAIKKAGYSVSNNKVCETNDITNLKACVAYLLVGNTNTLLRSSSSGFVKTVYNIAGSNIKSAYSCGTEKTSPSQGDIVIYKNKTEAKTLQLGVYISNNMIINGNWYPNSKHSIVALTNAKTISGLSSAYNVSTKSISTTYRSCN